jgi:hypothetical protein
MSAIASFIRLPVTALEELGDDYDNCIERLGQPVAEYDWSGYVLATLLVYLDKDGVKLMDSAYKELSNQLCQTRGSTIFIFTPAHKDAYLDRLSPERFSSDALRDYFNEFNATSEAGIGQAMLDGISCIQQSLSSIDAVSVVVLEIG